jgi:hypothetical protein
MQPLLFEPYTATSPIRASEAAFDEVEQRDAADEGRLEACGSIIGGRVIVNQGKVLRPSQLIASVGQTVLE